MQTWHLLAAGRAPLKRCQKVEGPGLSGLMIDFPINHWVVEKEGRRRNPHVSFAAAATTLFVSRRSRAQSMRTYAFLYWQVGLLWWLSGSSSQVTVLNQLDNVIEYFLKQHSYFYKAM